MAPAGFTTDAPTIRYRADDGEHELRCDLIAGCDGFHGVCRPSIPSGALRIFEHEYPFSWLGILAAVAPSTEELIYAPHERGFALHSLRSPEISRLYLQVPNDEDIAAWPDDRIWEELATRLALPGWQLADGPVLEKGISPMRSFVAEPMRSREALPGRRRRAHRAGHRREGPQPRGQRRARALRGDRRVVRDRRRTACWMPTRTGSSAAFGARSTSRSG